VRPLAPNVSTVDEASESEASEANPKSTRDTGRDESSSDNDTRQTLSTTKPNNHGRSKTMQYVGNWRIPGEAKKSNKKSRRVSDDMYIIEQAEASDSRRLEVFVQDRRTALSRERARASPKKRAQTEVNFHNGRWDQNHPSVSPQQAAARVALVQRQSSSPTIVTRSALDLSVINENVAEVKRQPQSPEDVKRSPTNSEKSPSPAPPSSSPPNVRKSSEKNDETPASSDVTETKDSVSPLVAKFQSLLKSATKEELMEGFRKIDEDCDGRITYREYCLFAVEEAQLPWDVDKCKQSFKALAKKRGDERYMNFKDLQTAFRKQPFPGTESFWLKLLRPHESVGDETSEEEAEIEDLDTIFDLLKNLKSPWGRRIAALDALKKQVPSERRQFELFMKRFSNPIKVQIQDRRSQVSKAACAASADMVAKRPRAFLSHTPFLLETLYEVVGMKAIRVMFENAHGACLKIVTSVNDNEEGILLRAIEKGTLSNRDTIRGPSYEYLKVYLEKLLENPESKKNESTLTQLQAMVKKGITDRNALARKNSFIALGVLEKVDKPRATKVISTMTPAVLKRYYTTIGRKPPPGLLNKRRPIRRYQRAGKGAARGKKAANPRATQSQKKDQTA